MQEWFNRPPNTVSLVWDFKLRDLKELVSIDILFNILLVTNQHVFYTSINIQIWKASFSGVISRFYASSHPIAMQSNATTTTIVELELNSPMALKFTMFCKLISRQYSVYYEDGPVCICCWHLTEGSYIIDRQFVLFGKPLPAPWFNFSALMDLEWMHYVSLKISFHECFNIVYLSNLIDSYIHEVTLFLFIYR